MVRTLTLLALAPTAAAAIIPRAAWPTELALSLAPQAALLASAMTVLALVFRRPRFALAAAAVAATCGWRISQGAPLAEPTAADDASLVIVWTNVLHRDEAVEAVFRLASKEGASLVAFGEFPASLRGAALERLAADYPYRAGGVAGDLAATHIFSRQPLETIATLGADGRRAAIVALDWPRSRSPSGSEVADGGILLGAVHAKTPLKPDWNRLRNRDLGDVAEALAPAGSALLIGDFNTVPWSPTLMRLTEDFDFRRADTGFSGTWLSPRPGLGLPIDHALVRGELRVSARVGPFVGSDHYPLIVRVGRTESP